MKKLSIMLVLFVLLAIWCFMQLAKFEDLEKEVDGQRKELDSLNFELTTCAELARETADLNSRLAYENLKLKEKLSAPPEPTPTQRPINKPLTPKNESKSPVSVVDSERFNSILAKRYAGRP